tara:strand:- start:486 stop:908 length:423 start_codon:yes stop_codon:yes gene_type:complete
MSNKIAIFSKAENKVIDTVYIDDLEKSNYKDRDDLYEYYDIPVNLVDYPIKIIKNNDNIEISIDDNLLQIQLPIIKETIRQSRNEIIKNTDYLLLEDVNTNKIKVKEYREYLRNIPNNITLENIKNNININILTYDEYIS